MLPLINKTQLSPNVSDLISGYGTGFFYSINNPSGYVTGTSISTGSFVSTGKLINYYPKNNPSGYISGNLSKYATTDNLGVLTTSYSILASNFYSNNYFTNSDLGTTLSSYMTVTTSNVQNIATSKIASNFTSTGTYLLNKLNSTGNNILGKFNTFTGSLGLGSQYVSIQNCITTGSLVGSRIASLSGSLVSTGQLLYNKINLLSGGLYATTGNLFLTGQTVSNNINSTGNFISLKSISINTGFLLNLKSTGNNIAGQILSQSGILNTSGRNLSNRILSTGSSLYSQTSIDIQYLTGQLSNYGSITGLNYLSNLVYSGNYQLTGKNVLAGSMIIIPSGNPTSQSYNTGLLSGAASASGSIFYQIQNTYTGATASSDLTLYNDLGTKYLDIGICSSQYDGTQYSPQFTVVGRNDSYMYSSGSNLAIGAIGTGVGINFFSNTTNGNDFAMVINNKGNVGIRKQLRMQAGTGFFTSGITISGYNLPLLPAITATSTTGQTILNKINSLSGTITGGYRPTGSNIFTVTLGNGTGVNIIPNSTDQFAIGAPFMPYQPLSALGNWPAVGGLTNYVTIPINCTIFAFTWAVYFPTTGASNAGGYYPIIADTGNNYQNYFAGYYLGIGIPYTMNSGVNFFSGMLLTPIPMSGGNNGVAAVIQPTPKASNNTYMNGSTHVITLYCSY